MKKIIALLMSVTLILGMTCVSFGNTDTQKDNLVGYPILIDENSITADANMEITIDLLENGGTQTIIPLFEGDLHVTGGLTPSSIAVYSGYFQVKSWKGSYITFDLGIKCKQPILVIYQDDIEIRNTNLIVLSEDKMDIIGLSASKSLVDDKKMYTGSAKKVNIGVKKITVATTAGPIYRDAIGNPVSRL